MSRSGIFILGDTHGEWDLLNTFINKKNPDIILQCGDFGFWPQFSGTDVLGKRRMNHDGRFVRSIWHQCGIKNPNTRIHWCDGNHEDHWELQKLTNLEICDKVFYQPRGSILTLPGGRCVLFMGGAESVDKHMRTVGSDWFPEEVITQKDLYSLPDQKIDIVISHTCPKEWLSDLPFNIDKNRDPSCAALSTVLEMYRPKLWYFGHWHHNKTGFWNGTRWFALNMASDTGWWQRLI